MIAMIRKLQQLTTGGHSFVITIPREFANELGLERGDYVKIMLKDNKIIMEKIKIP